MQQALVIGTDSVIGGALFERLQSSGMEVHGTARETLDLAANPNDWPALPKADVAYICAAISKLDACEQDPKAAYKVNVAGTTALARKLQGAETFVVFLSSNHVFDGTKPHRNASDPPSPINEYGRQKAQTEQEILAMKGAVLRLTKVIVPGDARIQAWYDALQAGKNVTAFDDIFLAPVTLDNVLDALTMIGQDHTPGIYQISGNEDFSYFDLACGIAGKLAVGKGLVARGSGASAGIPATFRPRYSSYRQVLPRAVKVPELDGIIAYSVLK